MSESLENILQIPLFWRVAIVMFVIWFIYMLASRGVFKLISLVPILFNFLWIIIYRLFNNVAHIIHKVGGKAAIGVDQTTTDFFGGVHGFTVKIRMAILGCCQLKSVLYDKDGREQHNKDGSVKYNCTPKKPFVGTAFLIVAILTIWISVPTWLNTEENVNIITAPFHKYIEIESRILEMVFG